MGRPKGAKNRPKKTSGSPSAVGQTNDGALSVERALAEGAAAMAGQAPLEAEPIPAASSGGSGGGGDDGSFGNSAPLRDTAFHMVKDLAFAGGAIAEELTGYPEAKCTEEEQLRLAEGVSPLIRKYFPNLGEGQISPEMAAVLCVVSVVGTKALIIRQKAKEKAEKEKREREAKEKEQGRGTL